MKHKQMLSCVLLALSLSVSSVGYAQTAPATTTSASNMDAYGQSLEYPANAEAMGCSKTIWDRGVNEYQNKMKEYRAKTEKMNKTIMERAAMHPDDVPFAGCFKKVEDVVNQFTKISDSITNIMNNGLSGLSGAFDGILKNIFNSVVKYAEGEVCKKVDGAVNKLNAATKLPELSKQIDDFSKNPFQYGLDKTGAGEKFGKLTGQ